MTLTDVTGRTCVGELRLAPLDLGFDPRASDTPVELPAWDFHSVGLEQDGRTWLVEGSRAELVAAIHAAGYRLAGDDATGPAAD
jgi:hypothetical protein